MRIHLLLLGLTMLLATSAYSLELPPAIQSQIDSGDFKGAAVALEAAANQSGLTSDQRTALQYEVERLNRIRYDFRITESKLLEDLRKDIPDATVEDLAKWREAGALESRVIDGERFYFRAAIRNLFRLSADARARRADAPAATPAATPATGDRAISIEERMARFLDERRTTDTIHVAPRRYRIDYTITVDADAVPDGKTVRCWMAYPRETPTQHDIRLLQSDPANPVVAPNETMQRTVYLERAAAAGQPTVFNIRYEFATSARVEFVDPAKVQPEDEDSALYAEFTADRGPHLAFTPRLRELERQIVGDETNPYLKARRIYEWIDANIHYTTALEYAVIPNISEYCAVNGRGDCGIQSLLFIALCRIAGVPAKWQSGWSLLPNNTNMHDWAEFYVAPYGWLPADASRGLRPSDDPAVRWFNFGNMDPYRLVANDDYSATFFPPKKHFRSEPVDSQRGEVEWEGGNLYFDKWDWHIEVAHLDE